MAMATGMVKRAEGSRNGTERMMGRLMLARMKTLEEGIQEVMREFKEMRTSTQANSPVASIHGGRPSTREGARDKGKKVVRRKSRPRSRAGIKGLEKEIGDETDSPKRSDKEIEKENVTPENAIIADFIQKGNSY
jgi:hypothetical protein